MILYIIYRVMNIYFWHIKSLESRKETISQKLRAMFQIISFFLFFSKNNIIDFISHIYIILLSIIIT